MKTLLIAVSVLVIPLAAKAHPYFPLKTGSLSSYDYKFRVDSQREELKKTAVNGRMTARNLGEVEKGGRKYFRFETSYEGIPYMTEKAELWRREEHGNLYMASMIRGKLVETLELPADVSVGQEWDYDDGMASRRRVTSRLAVTLSNGERIEDCLEVSRRVLNNENLKNVVNQTYYCRDKGDAGSLFAQPSPLGEYRTEVRLAGYSRGR